MKHIHKIFAFAAAAGLMLATNSCSDDFLQRDSLSAESAATFWQNPNDAITALVACYDALQSVDVYDGGPWGIGPLNTDCMTDDGGHFNWSGWMPGYDVVNGTSSTSNSCSSRFWSAYYEVIKRCNVLIANIDRVEGLGAEEAAQIKAEAKVLRSFMYLNLTSTFQDVPYLTEPLTLETAKVSKNSKIEIVPKLIAELTEAANALPVQAPALGRITKGAALAILGRVYLYNEMWSDAAKTYEQIIDLGCYELFDDYATLFDSTNEGCKEIIFSVRYTGPGQSEGGQFNAHWNTPLEALNGTIDLADSFYQLDGTPYPNKDDVGEWKDGAIDINKPNPDRYNNRDPRLKTTLWVPGMSWNGKSIANGNTYGGAAASYSTIYVNKYFNPEDKSNSWDGSDDFYIVRYAEVLLSLAEAYVEQGTNLDKAIQLVDQVRARVGMPKVEDVEKATSQADLREVVRHERRVELAFEGIRMYDMYRWHMIEEQVNKIMAEKAKYGFWYEDRFYRGEKDYVWPIPQKEIDANENLIQHDLWK